jgi:ubiquinone/menaquinone biosynthesis C-methylase UbiE
MNELVRKLYHNFLLNFFFPTLVYYLKRELSDCQTVLDLGCGPSSPIQHCKNIEYSVGVEIFEKYLKQSKKRKIHNKYLKKNILKLDFDPDSFDAVIMIEVLEHLSKKEGRAIIKKATRWAKKKVIISSPNGFIAQREVDNNPWQKHLSGWDSRTMKMLGFSSRGLAGLKSLRQEVSSDTMGDDLLSSIRFWPQPFWFVVAILSQFITARVPSLAFELFNVKYKR